MSVGFNELYRERSDPENWLKKSFNPNFEDLQQRIADLNFLPETFEAPRDNGLLAHKILRLEECKTELALLSHKLNEVISKKGTFQHWISRVCLYLHHRGWKSFSTLAVQILTEKAIKRVSEKIKDLKMKIEIPFEEVAYEELIEPESMEERVLDLLSDFQDFILDGFQSMNLV